MTPSANGGTAPTKGTSPSARAQTNGGHSHEAVVEDFMEMIVEISKKAPGKSLKALLVENEELKLQVEKQKAAKEVIQDDLVDIKQSEREKAGEVEKLLKSHQLSIDEITKLKQDLSEARSECQKMGQDYQTQTLTLKDREKSLNNVIALRDAATAGLEESERNRNLLAAEMKTAITERDEMKALTSFGVPLKPIGSRQTELSASLERVLMKSTTALKGLVFDQTLATAEDSRRQWDEFKSTDVVDSADIPLPRSNSTPARQMRFAIGLKVLAHTLIDNIFQPIYLNDENIWIEDSLWSMSKNHEIQEAHLRSMLLAFNPKKQQSLASERVEQACEDASSVLQLIVPKELHKDLKDRLQEICEDARAAWMHIQRVKENIAADFSVKSEEEWQVFRLPETQDTTASRPPGLDAGRTIQRQASSGALKLEEGVECFSVWPAFASHRWLLCQGYTLTGAQLTKARQELEKEAERDEKLRKEAEKAREKERETRRNNRKVPAGSGRRGSQA